MGGKSMNSVFELMDIALRLKETPRSGWNKKFPPGHKFSSRKIKKAESVAAHSFGCIFLAWLVAEELGLDPYKLMVMVMLHDLPEFIWKKDIPYESEKGIVRKKMSAKKELQEFLAINKILEIGGKRGGEIIDILLEFKASKTPEAIAAHEIDKLEMCFQASRYFKQGGQLKPLEFFETSARVVKNPKLRNIFSKLKKKLNQK